MHGRMRFGGLESHLIFFICVGIATALAYTNVPIGTIFDRRETEIESASRYAIYRHNNNATRLAVNLNAMTASINSANVFELSKAMCNEMAHGIFFILGTKNLKTVDVIQSYTSAFHMPYLTIGPVPNEVPYDNKFLLHLRPSYTATLVDLIRHFDWNVFHYMYDSYEGLLRVESMITALSQDDQFRDRLDVNAVEIVDINKAHAALKSIDDWKPLASPEVDVENMDSQQKEKLVRKMEAERLFPMRIIFLDVRSGARLQLLLRQLQEMGMNRPRYHYVIASLDVSEVELRGFIHSGVNITGFRLIDQQSKFVQTFLKQWSSLSENSWPGSGQLRLGVDVALVVDSISLMIDTLNSLLRSNHEQFRNNFRRGMVYNSNNTRILCEATNKPWEHGQLLIEEVKKRVMFGLTGRIAFNEHGYRTGYSLDIMTLVEKEGVRKVGSWNEDGEDGKRLVVDKHWEELKQEYEYDDRTYIMTTIPAQPFLMLKEFDDQGKPLIGNDRFIGYCADLIMHVAKQEKFHYIIKPVADNKYGAQDPDTRRWNGMIGEIIDEKADLAVAPLTITSTRERVVDFSKPFMNLGISIMIKKPEKSKPGVFSFMDPFSKRLWICISVACFSVGLVLFGVGRVSPYQWEITESPGEEPEVETEVSFFNTIWFSLGALMSQGGEMTLKSMSTRLVGSVWSLFTLIVISSYTANLAAFLTVERLVTPIDSAQDLAEQTKIAYGTLGGGSTQGFFSSSNITVYKKMWEYMDGAAPSVMVNTTEAGIARVRGKGKGKYAFLLESTVNDYTNQRKPCNTMRVGANLDSKGYGMAVQMNNPLRKRLNLAVLKLTEDSVLHELKKRWWYDKSECMFEDAGSVSNPLTLSNVAGIFYILMSGFGLAMLVSFIEFLHRSRKKDKRQIPLFDAIRIKVDSTISYTRPPDDSRTAIYGPQNGNGGVLNRRYSSTSPPTQRTGAISLV